MRNGRIDLDRGFGIETGEMEVSEQLDRGKGTDCTKFMNLVENAKGALHL